MREEREGKRGEERQRGAPGDKGERQRGPPEAGAGDKAGRRAMEKESQKRVPRRQGVMAKPCRDGRDDAAGVDTSGLSLGGWEGVARR